MDAIPLPPRPRLDQYRRQARELLRAARAGDAAALGRLAAVPRLTSAPGAAPALADAQYAVARAHGFASWPRFAAHVEALERRDPAVRAFEDAADAVVAGDLAGLRRLLDDDPALARARSARAHRATLLHYVSANGVEDYRQRTPPNAVEAARALLAAGAEPDAVADSYGGGANQTPLALTLSSVHPARAGLQEAIAAALLDGGACLEGPLHDGGPLLTALAFQYPRAAASLAARGARVDTLVAAAGLGRTDAVRALLARADAPLADTRVLRVPRTRAAQLGLALVWAASFGHLATVELLVRHGAAPGWADGQGFTALHWAVVRGEDAVAAWLIAHGAPLAARNSYGGTVLDTARWAAAHVPGVFRADGYAPVDHGPIIARLRAAGAPE